VKSDETVLAGYYGMGSEPDYNSVGFNGLPLEKMNHEIQKDNFILTPGVTSLKRFDASLIPLPECSGDSAYTNLLFTSGASDFANRGQECTLHVQQEYRCAGRSADLWV
jgi:hypothetical protein